MHGQAQLQAHFAHTAGATLSCVAGMMQQMGGGGGGQLDKTQDWACEECGTTNYGWRHTCNK